MTVFASTAKMEVGSQVETIQVEASAAVALQTDSSDLSALIPSNALTEMPTNGRNYYDLMGYEPGTTTASEANDPRTGQRQSMAFSANGQTSVYNNNMIDGMDNNQRSVGLVAVEPSLDALQEVKVETNNYSAEYSRTGGGIANLITKSGSNRFNGTLFEFMRNDAFDAYPWAAPKIRNELRQNQFGGSLGGPIIKNKIFFFGDYQGFRQIQGSTSYSTVPTPEEYASIHAYAAAPGSGFIALQDRWDGYGGKQEFDIGPGATTAYLSQPGPPQLASLQTKIDPLGLAYLMEAPKPNCPGDTYCYRNGQNNYVQASNKAVNTDTYDGRVDYHINDYNTLFVRYSYDHTVNNGGSEWPAAALVNGKSKTYLTGANDGVVTAQNGTLDYMHILSPTTVFEAKAGYARIVHVGPQRRHLLDNPGCRVKLFRKLLLQLARRCWTALYEPEWAYCRSTRYGKPLYGGNRSLRVLWRPCQFVLYREHIPVHRLPHQVQEFAFHEDGPYLDSPADQGS